MRAMLSTPSSHPSARASAPGDRALAAGLARQIGNRLSTSSFDGKLTGYTRMGRTSTVIHLQGSEFVVLVHIWEQELARLTTHQSKSRLLTLGSVFLSF